MRLKKTIALVSAAVLAAVFVSLWSVVRLFDAGTFSVSGSESAKREAETSNALASGHAPANMPRVFFKSVPMFIEQAPTEGLPSPVHAPNDPHILFTLEARDPEWAPKMEQSLTDYHSRGNLGRAGLQDVEIVDIDCRQTTCRFVYEHPAALSHLAENMGLPPGPPLQVLEEQLGPVANRGSGHHTERFERNGQAFVRQSLVLGFTEENWAPDEMAGWAASQQPRMKALFDDYRADRSRVMDAEPQPPAHHGG